VRKETRVAIFISGKGTNALNLMRYFENNEKIKIALIFSTRTNDTLEKASDIFCVQYSQWIESQRSWLDVANQACLNNEIDFIVLAGFLKKIPSSLIQKFPKRIINLHPSLLPMFGGKGMYGSHVHEAVIASGVKISGITIHFVNEEFDEGEIIFQKEVRVSKNDTAKKLALKVQKLEQTYLPKVLESLLCSETMLQDMIELRLLSKTE
jgi:phosphoribosylglycinamide formyltransferase-1